MTRSLALATLVVSEEKARKHSEEEEGPRLLILPRALLFADCKLRVLSLRARARARRAKKGLSVDYEARTGRRNSDVSRLTIDESFASEVAIRRCFGINRMT